MIVANKVDGMKIMYISETQGPSSYTDLSKRGIKMSHHSVHVPTLYFQDLR